MKRLSLIVLSTVALGSVALAEDKAATSGSSGSEMQKSDKMKGPPNASGADKTDKGGSAQDTTGTAGGGAASAKATGEADGGAGKK